MGKLHNMYCIKRKTNKTKNRKANTQFQNVLNLYKTLIP